MRSRNELSRQAQQVADLVVDPPGSIRAMRKAVEEFNAIAPIGTAVNVRLDDGTVFATTTRAAADMLGGHTAVVWVKGISGAYLLSRVSRA